MLNSLKKYSHPEKCFVESTKIWLAQQNFLIKYGSMEILFELTKEILLIFFCNFNKNNLNRQQKTWNCKLKLENYCRIKRMILLIQIKMLTIFFSPRNKIVFLLQLKHFLTTTKMYSTKHVLLF